MGIVIYYLTLIIGALIATTVNEFTKAYVSYKLGDIGVKNMGKVTLNPLKHFEPIGFLFILFLGYGWGKPVETNSMYYKNRKKGTILVYSIPILVNFILSVIFYNLSFLWSGFNAIAQVNLALAVFNLLPIYPLCGYKILKVSLSIDRAVKFCQYEKIIQILCIMLIFIGPLKYVLDSVVLMLASVIKIFVFIK